MAKWDVYLEEALIREFDDVFQRPRRRVDGLVHICAREPEEALLDAEENLFLSRPRHFPAAGHQTTLSRVLSGVIGNELLHKAIKLFLADRARSFDSLARVSTYFKQLLLQRNVASPTCLGGLSF